MVIDLIGILQAAVPVKGHILRDENGNELKEWYAMAAYLEQFGAEGLPSRYADPANGCKHVYSGFAPGQLLLGWNWITWAVLGIAALLLAVIVLLVRLVCRRIRKQKQS